MDIELVRAGIREYEDASEELLEEPLREIEKSKNVKPVGALYVKPVGALPTVYPVVPWLGDGDGHPKYWLTDHYLDRKELSLSERKAPRAKLVYDPIELFGYTRYQRILYLLERALLAPSDLRPVLVRAWGVKRRLLRGRGVLAALTTDAIDSSPRRTQRYAPPRTAAPSEEAQPVSTVLTPKEQTRQDNLQAALRTPGLFVDGSLRRDWVELCGRDASMIAVLQNYLRGPGNFIGVDKSLPAVRSAKARWGNISHVWWAHAELCSLLAKAPERFSNVGAVVYDSCSRPEAVMGDLLALHTFATRQAKTLGGFLLVLNTCLNGVSEDAIGRYKSRVERSITHKVDGMWQSYRSHAGSPVGMLLIRLVYTPARTSALPPLSYDEFSSVKLPKRNTQGWKVLSVVASRWSHDEGTTTQDVSTALGLRAPKARASLAYLVRAKLVSHKGSKYTPESLTMAHPDYHALLSVTNRASGSPEPAYMQALRDAHADLAERTRAIQANAGDSDVREALLKTAVDIYNSKVQQILANK